MPETDMTFTDTIEINGLWRFGFDAEQFRVQLSSVLGWVEIDDSDVLRQLEVIYHDRRRTRSDREAALVLAAQKVINWLDYDAVRSRPCEELVAALAAYSEEGTA